MISIKALGMYSSDFSGGETRNGDTQIVTDWKYYDVIDGGCDRYATRLITYLRTNNIRDPYLHASHPHYDHIDGIDKILSDPWFTPRALYCQDPDSITAHNSSIRSDINKLREIVTKAKEKKIPVIFLDNEDRIEHGDIKITVYRQYPKYSGNSDAYLNDGSLCYWFAEQRYLTTGDASMWCAYKYNLNPLIVKGGHHGNDMSADGYLKPSEMCPWLYKNGCRYYWDNDFSTKLTDFLMTGREDAINAKLIVLNIHGDIDMTFARGKVTITHAGKSYTDSVPYNGDYTECWIKNTVGWWYRYKDGSWPAKCFADLRWSQGISTFYFNERGYMVTGWKKVDGKWYFFDEKSGAMKKGWIFWDGSWFYLDPESGVMHTGWIDYKKKRCFLEPSGRALRNCIRTIDGKTYQFDNDCYATEISGPMLFSKAVGKLNEVGTTRLQFVLDIANYVRKYAPQYDIKVYSPIIAQAIHESGWGESKLSAKYHNYFGMKCGTKWTGRSVNMKTQEEYSAGSLSTISANFRAYDNMEEGVKGYFEFIQLPRYANLKGVTSPRQYLQNIKDDGYATGSQYVTNTMNLITLYDLTQFDVALPAAEPALQDQRAAINQNYGFKGYNVGKRTDPIMYIVIHYTGAEGTAKDNIDYFNSADRLASADFFVGHKGEIWQYTPDVRSYYAWHCGGGRQSSKGGTFYGRCKNANSIGIELCTHKVNGSWIFTDETVAAAKQLVRYLMEEYGVKAANVIRHFDVTGKACPNVSGWLEPSGKWDAFKASLTSGSVGPVAEQIYRVRKNWADSKSQLGAFMILANAKAKAAANPGYHVYDSTGKEV